MDEIEKTEQKTTRTSKKLPMRHALFCLCYTNIGDPTTFGNGSRAYKKAGFRSNSPGTSANRLLKKPDIQTRIDELYAELVKEGHLTPQYIIANIRHVKQLALEKGDLTTALRATELEGRTIALFAEKNILAVEMQVPSLTAEEQSLLDPACKDLKRAIAGIGDGKPKLLPTAPIPGMTSYKPEQEAAFEPENSDNTDNAEVEEDKPEPEPEERVPYRGYMPPQRATHSTNEFS